MPFPTSAVAPLLLLAVAVTYAIDDPLALAYGNANVFAPDLVACRAITNGDCAQACCPTNFTLTPGVPGVTASLYMYFDSSTYSRCGAGGNQYWSGLTLTNVATPSMMGATGTPVSNMPVKVFFGVSPRSLTLYLNTPSQPTCQIRSDNFVKSSAPDVARSGLVVLFLILAILVL
jgi:hypothetical protein